MKNASVRRAIIIGGGIGGLSAAIALRQAGVEAIVYEQAPALRSAGAGLTLWANAMRALEALELAKAILSHAARIRQAEILNRRGQRLARIYTDALERRYGAPFVAIQRADLLQILVQALPNTAIHTGKTFVKYEQDPAGVSAHFMDGQSDRADLLIGADGLHSTVRRQLFPDVSPRYAGYTAWRGLAADEILSQRRETSETWGCGSRFGIVPIGNGQVYWFATANQPEGQKADPAQHRARLETLFRDWHAPIPALIAATLPEAILHNDLYDISPLGSWSQGRVTLLGDAAHATTPNLGQGACQAIESSLALACCLGKEADFSYGLREYEAARLPRSAWITRQSARFGRVAQIDRPLGCALRDLLLQLTPSFVLRSSLDRTAGSSR